MYVRKSSRRVPSRSIKCNKQRQMNVTVTVPAHPVSSVPAPEPLWPHNAGECSGLRMRASPAMCHGQVTWDSYWIHGLCGLWYFVIIHPIHGNPNMMSLYKSLFIDWWLSTDMCSSYPSLDQRHIWYHMIVHSNILQYSSDCFQNLWTFWSTASTMAIEFQFPTRSLSPALW